jgi:hypothetical protein
MRYRPSASVPDLGAFATITRMQFELGERSAVGLEGSIDYDSPRSLSIKVASGITCLRQSVRGLRPGRI